MKRWLPGLAAAAAVLLLCGFFTAVLLAYARPMGAASYDLTADRSLWSVFTQEGDRRTELAFDGSLGYTGLSAPGQTFYYARLLTEEVENPVLTLDTVNRSVAVFLDGAPLYTDCPEQTGGIGSLALPMLGWDRLEPVEVSLPPDYGGKTLTIAQSTGLGEKQEPEPEVTVYLCQATLSCGYSYESGLIAESFQAGLPAALAFGLGLLLAAAFLWQGLRGRWDAGLLAAALAVFAWMASRLATVSFFYRYFPAVSGDLNALCHALSLTALLAFLGSRAGRRGWPLWCAAALHGGFALAGGAMPISLPTAVSEYAGLAGLLAAGLAALDGRRRGDPFFRLFAPLFWGALGAGIGAWGVRALMDPQWGQALLNQLWTGLQNGMPRFFLWKWAALALAAGTLAAFLDLFRRESERRTQARLLLQRGQLAQENYEELRRHNGELMALRHDLRHHVTALQGLCRRGELEAVGAYLDQLAERPELSAGVSYTVHPAVNAVLTAMAGRGAPLGVRMEVKVALPDALPIPDSDLCPLLMNLLENALEASEKAPEGADKWVRVTMHIRGEYLYVGVENARFAPVSFDREERLYRSTKSGELHGLGLRSARAIARKYHSELVLEAAEGMFSASTALLLPERGT